jgi:16S rRNA (cytosine967-C5)-methyltransferase
VDIGLLATPRGGSILRHAAELFRLLAKSSQESSALASSFLHAKKHISPEEKALISAWAFSALRNKILIEHAAESAARERDQSIAGNDRGIRPAYHMIAALIVAEGDDNLEIGSPAPPVAGVERHPDAFETDPILRTLLGLDGDGIDAIGVMRDAIESVRSRIADEKGGAPTAAAIAVACSAPEWIVESWLRHMVADRARSLADALRHDAPVDLRVNLTRIARAEVVESLCADGIDTRVTPWSPAGLRLRGRALVLSTAAYRNGWIEIQDEGSQLIARALRPDPSWVVLDACAGTGGKALHLADLRGDTGTIEARDIDARKLRALTQRARRCGFGSIAIATPDARNSGRRETTRRFDAVLVDAPCSGLGTARRAPMMKWRLTPRMLGRLATAQRAILGSAASELRDGGVLVYATCSLLREENEAVVEWLLESDPRFRLDDLYQTFADQGIRLPDLEPGGGWITIRPDVHGTDGFFVARLRCE